MATLVAYTRAEEGEERGLRKGEGIPTTAGKLRRRMLERVGAAAGGTPEGSSLQRSASVASESPGNEQGESMQVGGWVGLCRWGWVGACL